MRRPRLRPGLAALPAGLLVTAALLAPVQPARACDSAKASSSELHRCLLIEKGIRANHEGRLVDADAIWRQLRALDPSDPEPVLHAIETAWWRNMLDDGVEAYYEAIRAGVAEALRLAEARLEKDPDDAIALYQQGEALMHSARLNGMTGSYLRAGSDGERGRVALERALALRPSLTEIKYQLGLYNYYSSVAPRFLKYVSWLWFIPKGDYETGLRYLGEVRDGGGRHSVDATFILMVIDTYHAPLDLAAALRSARALHARFPTNPVIHLELVEVMLKIELYEEAIAQAREIENTPPITPEAAGRPQMARVLRAQGHLMSGDADEAWRLLSGMDPETSVLPTWGGAWIYLFRAQIHDVRGERTLALAEYQRVLGLEGGRHSRRAAGIAEACIETPFEPSAYVERPMISAAPE